MAEIAGTVVVTGAPRSWPVHHQHGTRAPYRASGGGTTRFLPSSASGTVTAKALERVAGGGGGPDRHTRGRTRRWAAPCGAAHRAGCGGAGNRTRVLRRFARASPSAARCAFLSPTDHASESVRRAQSRLVSPHGPRDETRLASLLTDAGYWTEGTSRPTDPLPASGGESEVSALSVGAYWFPTTIYETTSASSARFPCRNVRSRNLSPPCRCYLPAIPGGAVLARCRYVMSVPRDAGTTSYRCRRMPVYRDTRITPRTSGLIPDTGRR